MVQGMQLFTPACRMRFFTRFPKLCLFLSSKLGVDYNGEVRLRHTIRTRSPDYQNRSLGCFKCSVRYSPHHGEGVTSPFGSSVEKPPSSPSMYTIPHVKFAHRKPLSTGRLISQV